MGRKQSSAQVIRQPVDLENKNKTKPKNPLCDMTVYWLWGILEMTQPSSTRQGRGDGTQELAPLNLGFYLQGRGEGTQELAPLILGFYFLCNTTL